MMNLLPMSRRLRCGGRGERILIREFEMELGRVWGCKMEIQYGWWCCGLGQDIFSEAFGMCFVDSIDTVQMVLHSISTAA